MTRKTYRSAEILFLFALLLAVACSSGETQKISKVEEFPDLTLSSQDKEKILFAARALVTGGSIGEKTDVFSDEGQRGVFVTLARRGQRAVTAFGLSTSIEDALSLASKKVRELAQGQTDGALRVDVVSGSKKFVKSKLGDEFKIDLSNDGVLFGVKPYVAFLPQELRDFGVLGGKKYSDSAMKKLLKHRGFDKTVDSQLAGGSEIRSMTLHLISFMEGEGGKETDLVRGNRNDGFEPTPERLYQAIDAAGKYLTKATGPDGKFEYLYLPQKNEISESYNLLRHAGTDFSMAQMYEVTKDPELLEAIKRSLVYLAKTADGPNAEDAKIYDWKAVREKDSAKLGGVGLALLAFAKYTQVSGDQQYVPLMQGFAKFVEYLQDDNGDLRQKYWYKVSDRNKPVKPVLYYPGESFFGLGMLFAIDHDARWTKIMEKGIDYIADVRDAKTPTEKLEHDHWMLYAINEMSKIRLKDNQRKHADRVMEAMLAKFNFEMKEPEFVGGWFKKPKVTPTACRLEATSAYYNMVTRLGDKQMADKTFKMLELGASFLMRNQYNKYNTIFFPNPDKPIGAYPFDWWDPSIQIDVVQHTTSALIATRQAIMDRQKAAAAPVDAAKK